MENEQVPASNEVVRTRITATFAGEGLRAPFWPTSFDAPVVDDHEWQVSSAGADAPPFQLREYVDAFVDDPRRELLVVAHSGHGSSSWALCNYVGHGRVGVFIHSAWGGSTGDDASVRSDDERWAARVDAAEALTAALADHPPGDHEALAVVISDFHPDRWARWQIGSDPEWINAADPFAAALTTLA